MNLFGLTARVLATVLVFGVLTPILPVNAAPSPASSPAPIQSAAAAKAAPKNTKAPTISGTTRVPNQLSVKNGTWSGAPTSYTYQWFRCTATVKKAAATLAASCSTINSATAAIYTLTDADAGKFMVARVSGVNATGTVSIHSASTSAVVAQFLPPGNTVAPVVTGSTVTTSTLSASNGAWTESPTTHSYQWFRCAKLQKAPGNALASGCSNISGAVGATYDLVGADVGKFVGVAVTARNVAGSSVKWSKTTAAVTAFPTPANTVAPVVSGTAQVSRILTLSNGTWNNRPTGYAYKWYACTASKAAGTTLPSGCTQIAGETDATYQLLPGQQSRFVLGLVTATNVSGSTARYSATTTAVGVPSPYAPSALVQPLVDIDGNSGDAISGRAMVGSVLVADEGTWLGYPIPEKRFSYWYQCAAPVTQSSSTQPAGCYVIEGSEGDINHVVTLDDLGSYLMYEVIATNTQGVVRNYTPTTSAVTATPIPYVQPALTGDPSYDSVLEISDGAWATPPSVDVDLFYSWHRCATATPVVLAGVPVDCEEIDGAQDSSYTVTEDDLGIYVFGVVTAVNSFDESASAVATTMGISDAAPELVTTPVISGTRVSGNALSVSEANYVAYPDPTVTVQWLRCTAAVSTATATLPGTCSAITGETGQSYTLVDADLGRFITARTMIVNTVGTLTTIAASTVAVGSVPVFTVSPAVTGTTIVGSTLTVSTGTATGTPTPTRTYQWLRCTDAIETVASSVPETCATISGATAATYVTTVADTGKRLAVRVIATNAISTATSVTLTTAEVDVAPNRLTAPALSGTRTQGDELSVTDGTWSGHPTPTITYQWVRCTVAVAANTFAAPNTCVNISGATLSTHTATADDLGKFVTAIVTATNTRGSASTLAPSATSIASLPATVATPVVTGTATRGSVLSTTQIAWTGTPTPSLSLQWYRCVSPVDTAATVVPDGCAAISGATAATYTIVEADAGKYLAAASVATNVAGTARKIALSTTIVQSLPAIVVAPTITGDRWLGSELTVADGQWFEYPEATVTYQWYRCSSPVTAAATVPAHCSESITGATSSTYTLDGSDAGKYLTAVVEHTNLLGTTRHIAAQTIATFLPPSIDTEPTLTGTAALGSTLTLDEGLWTGYPAPNVTSTWYSCDSERETGSSSVPDGCVVLAGQSAPVAPNVDAGHDHSCAVLSRGIVKCWGYNGTGQLGDGSLAQRLTPVTVAGLSDAISVSAGMDHSCAVLSNGTVKCWGGNGNGQLGDGSVTQRLTPVNVTGMSGAISVSVGVSYSCAVVAGGTVKCWGYNGNGQLGDGSTSNRMAPVEVAGLTGAISVAAGQNHTCAVLVSGIVRCWGYNGNRELGDGSVTQRMAPVTVSGVSGAISVSVGVNHSCAVVAGGLVKCWGSNTEGNLGDGSTTRRLTPVTVAGVSGAVSISGAANHTCVAGSSGEVRCWGYNGYGQLGDGSGTRRLSPVIVPYASGAVAVTTGHNHTCVALTDGLVTCWGKNDNGQLGDGSTTQRAWPSSGVLAGRNVLQLDSMDVGRFIAIRVVAVNSGSSTTYFSPTTEAVTAPPTPTTNPSTTGTRLVGQTLTLSPGVFVEYPASDSVAYKWYRCSAPIGSTTTSSDSCYLISDANDLTYTQTADDAGYYVSGAVTRTNSIASVTAWSAASSTTNQAPLNVIDGFIDGEPVAGTSLNASEGLWQGFPVPSLQFQWYRCSSAVASVVSTVPAGCATIAAATTSNYLLAPADMGHYITFAVTRANTLGTVTRVAQSTAVITGVPVVVTAPAVSGTRVSGSALTVSTGLWLAHPSATTTRQWYRCTSTVSVTESTPSGCAAIDGETGLTYTQTLADAGKYLTAATTQTNANGSKTVWAAASLTSNYPPTLVTEPSISGTASFNSTLSAATGEWLGFPTPTPTYQWYRCAAEVASETSTVPAGCDVIATSGSSATYTAVGPDMGKFLVVRVTQTNSVTSSVRFTRSTAVVTGSPVAQIAPEIAGIRTLGQTLSVTDGTWWAHPAISDNAYQWYRCSAAVSSAIATVPGTCAEIEGEDANSYVLTTDDSGAFITAKVSRTNSVGTSAMVAAQTTASTQIPTNTAGPSISGTINMGELLTASEGTWQGFPRPTYTYEWLECSSEVATASSTRPAGCAEFQSDAKISAGSTHTCVAQADGTAYCWGASSGSFSTSTPTAQSGSDKVVQVASGNGFTCYVLVDSSVKCFGTNGSGQVGDGSTTTRATPVSASGLRGVRSVDAGDAFACALMIDGTVQCWGNNASGQLGLGNTTNKSTPQVVPGLTNIISLDAGASHACAVISGGTVKCWGLATSGQIGDGSTASPRLSPASVSGMTTAVSVSAGGAHSCAVLNSGGIRCWGLNTNGQLGNSSQTSTSAPAAQALTSSVATVSAGASHTCVVMSDGTAKCWGLNASGQLGTGNTSMSILPTTVSGLSGVSNISAGGSHTCVTHKNGSISCWGLNSSGQVGDGTTTSPRATATLRTFNLSRVLINEAEFGKRLVSAVTATNSVGTAVKHSSSTDLVISPPFLLRPPSLSSGANFGTTLTAANGSWASSSAVTRFDYQWYRCTAAVSAFQTTVPATCEAISDATSSTYGFVALDAGKHIAVNVTAIAVSGQTSITSASNGPVTVPPTLSVAPTVTGSARLDGVQTVTTGTWIGHPALSYSYSWYRCSTETQEIVGGVPTSCVLISGATSATYTAVAADLGNYLFPVVRASNSGGAVSSTATTIGIVSTSPRKATEPTITGTRVVGSLLSAGLGSWIEYPSGTSSVQWYRCNSNVSVSTTSAPPQCSPIEGATDSTYTQAEADAGNFLVIAETRVNEIGQQTVWTNGTSTTNRAPYFSGAASISGVPRFGGNLQAGNGDWLGYPAPAFSYQWAHCSSEISEPSDTLPNGCTPILGALQVDAEDASTCALIFDGTVRCWGHNSVGQLGDGTTTRRSTPVTVSGVLNALEISVARSHACALVSDGTVKCWGQNTAGKLGNGTTTNSLTAVPVSGITDAISISVGGDHSCALLSSGRLKCWGSNDYGQLGDGTLSGRTSPVTVSSVNDFESVSVGSGHTCALRTDKSVVCWGQNIFGQIGDGTQTNRPTPTPVSIPGGVTSISAGGQTSCAVLANGTARCWGYNGVGQVGDGTETHKLLPVSVSGLENVTQISAGYSSTCARLADATLKCWGANGMGEIGDGTQIQRLTPVTSIQGAGVVSVSKGSGYTCAVLNTGQLSCWGNNPYGNIGDGTTSTRLTSTLVNGVEASLGSQFELLAPMLGKHLMVKITGSNALGTQTVSTPTVFTSSVPTLVNDLSIAGEPTTGKVLAGTAPAWAAFPRAVDLSYQWYRCTGPVSGGPADVPAGCASIDGANGSSYVLAAADEGDYVTLATSLTNARGTTRVFSAANEIAFGRAIFTRTSTTWTVPSGVTEVRVLIVGGGGWGGNGGLGNGAGGGGGAVIETSVAVTPGESIAVRAGEPEQTSVFGSLSASAGRNGAGNTPGDGYTGTTPMAGDTNTWFGGGLPVYSSVSGSNLLYGGGGGPGYRPSGTTYTTGPDGAGQYGYGGGGGGNRTGQYAGRVGGNGIVLIRWVSANQ
jgi:alpha-tubulin suppressor-like RCC1 family protein